MPIWNHPPEFAEAFLAEHHDYVLVDAFHRIKAHFLYPLNCRCKKPCRCEDLRVRVILSLNVGLYNQAEDRHEDLRTLSALRHFLQIPEDRIFRRHLNKLYPPDFIQDAFQKKEDAKHFQIIDQLVWTLLRLRVTYENSWLREPRATLHEAIKMILGTGPLKSKGRKQGRGTYLCGEKGYATQFAVYKPVCHFMASLQFADPGIKNPCLSVADSKTISQFLKVSHWVREELLEIQTPNVKEKSLFPDGSLLSLPPWVNSDDIDIPLEPFQSKLQAINKQYADAIDASYSLRKSI